MLLQYLALLETDREKDFFTDIYKKHKTELYFKAYNIVHNAEDAEDMVQETFLSLIRNVDKVINEKPYKVWFYMETIVKNRSLNLLKRRKIQETPGLDETWMQEEIMEKGPDILMEEFEVQEALAGLLKRLKHPYKEVLILQYYYQMKPKEIAVELETTADNVRHISKRAKEKLQSILEENGLWNEKGGQGKGSGKKSNKR